MSCSSSHLGLTETNDGEQANKNIICSVPVMFKGPEEIIPIDLNLSNDNRTALTQIIKVVSLVKFFSISFLSIGHANEIPNGMTIWNDSLYIFFLTDFFVFFDTFLLALILLLSTNN